MTVGVDRSALMLVFVFVAVGFGSIHEKTL
jgi:hypothetical protein